MSTAQHAQPARSCYRAKGNERQLRRRGNTWHVNIAVPSSLQERIGKRVIERSTKAASLIEARRRAPAIVAEIQSTFARAAGGDGLVDRALAFRGAGDSSWIDDALALDGRSGNQFAEIVVGRAEPIKSLSGQWLDEVRGAITEQTRVQHKQAFALLLEKFGELATVAAIDRKKAGEFVAHLLKTPGRDKKTPRSRPTVARLVSTLASFWKWAIGRGYAESNPWRGLEIGSDREAENRKRGVFSDKQLLKLLRTEPKGHVRGKALGDLIRLGMFTGARIRELCELRVGDVRSGMIHVTASKTPAGVRAIPVHDAIKGIVAKRCEGKEAGDALFAEIEPGGADKKRSYNATKYFGHFKRDCGITDTRLVFHSFRHMAVTRLLAAGVEPHVVARLVGHAVKGVTLSVYDKGPSPAALKSAMNKLSYAAPVMKTV